VHTSTRDDEKLKDFVILATQVTGYEELNTVPFIKSKMMKSLFYRANKKMAYFYYSAIKVLLICVEKCCLFAVFDHL
jgi:hypothetical protein